MPCIKKVLPTDHCVRLKADSRQERSLSELIGLYRSMVSPDFYHKRLSVLSSTVEWICGLPDNGDGSHYKKSPHQFRMTAATIENARKVLEGINPKQFADFDAFIEEVRRRTLSIRGFGPLAVYDFSLRCGYNYGVVPKNYVYIQSGAREGAKRLKKRELLGFKSGDNKIHIDNFPKELQSLGAIHIENFLCIMKSHL